MARYVSVTALGRGPPVAEGAAEGVHDARSATVRALRRGLRRRHDGGRTVEGSAQVAGCRATAGEDCSLEDVDAAVVDGNYAIEAGRKPASQALVLEKTEGNPYVNGLVVRADHDKDANIVTLGKLLRDQRVKDFIQQKYAGSPIPAE
ncbi:MULTISPECIES: MetQ/NlpA family ABC transporter substrate-binding protein [unclassified Nonomuraea]|uniref:MetQ/NlpA family ABC transporter substrate-binding protein n=1 Tax=unclassified Nonomuraea TaxID=2593643 RepID=UPI00207BC1CE|nr:MetQ/NlpA family ABC transporter substrate-binding protein [Nonomuraea sp. KC401]